MAIVVARLTTRRPTQMRVRWDRDAIPQCISIVLGLSFTPNHSCSSSETISSFSSCSGGDQQYSGQTRRSNPPVRVASPRLQNRRGVSCDVTSSIHSRAGLHSKSLVDMGSSGRWAVLYSLIRLRWCSLATKDMRMSYGDYGVPK